MFHYHLMKFWVIDHEHWNDRSSKKMFYDIENISPNLKDTFDEIVNSVRIHRIHLTETTTTTISSNKITPFTNEKNCTLYSVKLFLLSVISHQIRWDINEFGEISTNSMRYHRKQAPFGRINHLQTLMSNRPKMTRSAENRVQ